MSRLEAINEHDTHARGVELRGNTGKMLRNVKDRIICTKKGRTHKDMVHPAADFGCNGYYICSSVSFIVMMLLYEQSRTLQILIISFSGKLSRLSLFVRFWRVVPRASAKSLIVIFFRLHIIFIFSANVKGIKYTTFLFNRITQISVQSN